MPFFLGVYRISETKRIADAITGQTRLEDTDLTNRARARGISDEDMMAYAKLQPRASEAESIPDAVRKAITPDGYTFGNGLKTANTRGNHELSSKDLLSLLAKDISSDICGNLPLSSLNYTWVLARFMMVFHQFEEELSKLRNRLYVQAYETDPMWRLNKRVGLTYLALHEQDEECLLVMARALQNPRAGFMNHMY